MRLLISKENGQNALEEQDEGLRDRLILEMKGGNEGLNHEPILQQGQQQQQSKQIQQYLSEEAMKMDQRDLLSWNSSTYLKVINDDASSIPSTTADSSLSGMSSKKKKNNNNKKKAAAQKKRQQSTESSASATPTSTKKRKKKKLK
eukprot:jgi/Bigna1/132987/aug1.19_g7695